jgi:hypothetical protein
MTPSGIKPATFRFVAQRFNHCATAVPVVISEDDEFTNEQDVTKLVSEQLRPETIVYDNGKLESQVRGVWKIIGAANFGTK